MEESRGSGGDTINISGSVQGSAVALGDHNSQVVRSGEAFEGQVDLIAALDEIKAALAGLSGPYAPAVRANLDTAVAQAAAEDADPSAVGAAIEMAMNAARRTTEFAEVAGRLAPWVAKVTSMLATLGVPLNLG